MASHSAAASERFTLHGGKGGGARGGHPGGSVAETPRVDSGRATTDARGADRGRSASRRREDRERADDGSRGRSIRRREGSYDRRGVSMITNRSRSQLALRDRNTSDVLPTRLYNLSRALVEIGRHAASDLAMFPS